MTAAAIAQLGERQTEDLKVPSLILGLGRRERRVLARRVNHGAVLTMVKMCEDTKEGHTQRMQAFPSGTELHLAGWHRDQARTPSRRFFGTGTMGASPG